MRRRLTYLALTLVVAALAAGCGGDDAATTAAPIPASDPNAAPVANGAPSATATGGSTAAEIPDVEGSDLPGGLGALDGDSGLFNAQADFAEDAGGADLDPNLEVPVDEFPEGDEAPEPDEPEEAPEPKEKVKFGPAKVSLDGQTYTIGRNSIFPSDTQLFQVLSMTGDSIEVELVAGEFSNGSSGVTLDKGKEVKLVNQNEGVTYTLKLLSVAKNSSGGATPVEAPFPTDGGGAAPSMPSGS